MRNKALITGIIATAAIAIGCSSAGDDEDDSRGPGVQDKPAQTASAKTKGKKVVLEVGGAKKANSITYGLGGDISQDNNADLPWKKTVTLNDSLFSIVSLSAQNAGSGTITCKITLDGKVVKENESKGEYAIVTCDGSDLG